MGFWYDLPSLSKEGAVPFNVFVAIQQGTGLVGYFITKEEIPAGFKICLVPELDITDILETYGWTKEKALEEMNRSWRNAPVAP
ncbi:MAG: hypothetical protein Q7S03_02395 [bacterium]|nr:hypothetical protein [bacterium]